MAWTNPKRVGVEKKQLSYRKVRINCWLIRSDVFIFFIVALCILKSAQFTHQQMHYLLTWLKVLSLH